MKPVRLRLTLKRADVARVAARFRSWLAALVGIKFAVVCRNLVDGFASDNRTAVRSKRVYGCTSNAPTSHTVAPGVAQRVGRSSVYGGGYV